MSQEQPPRDVDKAEAKPASEPTKTDRTAIVFLAGLGAAEAGDSVDKAARRIANALDDEATPRARFLIEEGRDEDYGEPRGVEGRTRRLTIAYKDNPESPSRPLVDLYSLDYRKTLMGDLPQKRPLKLLLLICWTLLANANKLLFSIQSRGKTSTEKWQVRIAWFWFSMLGLYGVIILGAVLGTVLEAVPPSPRQPPPVSSQQPSPPSPQKPAPTPTSTPGTGVEPETKETGEETVTDGLSDEAKALAGKLWAGVGSALQPIMGACQLLVVWLTALGLFLKTDIKAMIRKSGVETVAANRYLTLGAGKDSITDRFSALLNHIAERDDVTYRDIYVVAYSFGTIATLDALYPHGKPPAIFQTVKGLVTIGCPFDFIRTYWPDYFDQRCADGTQRRWLNIFARADVLSSDFKDVAAKGADPEGGGDGQDEVGISADGGAAQLLPKSILYGRDKALDDYGPIERWGLIGFRAHTQYWEEGTAGCYRDIVREFFLQGGVLPRGGDGDHP